MIIYKVAARVQFVSEGKARSFSDRLGLNTEGPYIQILRYTCLYYLNNVYRKQCEPRNGMKLSENGISRKVPKKHCHMLDDPAISLSSKEP